MSSFQGFKFDDSHIVDYDDLVFYNHQWMIVDINTNSCVCIVGAESESDAFDEACNADKLDRYQIPESDIYPDIEDDVGEILRPIHDFTRLGNACEPFDLTNLRCIELPAVRMSYCASFDRQHGAIVDDND